MLVRRLQVAYAEEKLVVWRWLVDMISIANLLLSINDLFNRCEIRNECIKRLSLIDWLID